MIYIFYQQKNEKEDFLKDIVKLKGHNMKNSSKVPLYVQIVENIRFKIYNDEWEEGHQIPTEMDLCKHYNVGRITIRKAVEELVNERLLYRKRAKGTFVSNK